jgi:hypothetical protein
MMRKLRRVNVDHLHVGWYQSADVGNFISQTLLESQYHYQNSIEESVVLIYGKFFLIVRDKVLIQEICRYPEDSKRFPLDKSVQAHAAGHCHVQGRRVHPRRP